MLDEVQALMREDRIGASEAAACVGRHPWMTPYDLWALKTGRARDFHGNKYTDAGAVFEPGILDWFSRQMDQPLARDICCLHSDGIRLANLDGFMPEGDEPGIVEAKTSGLFSRGFGTEAWGDPAEGGEPPEHVIIQVHQQFACAEERWPGVDLAHVVAFIGGRGFVHYRVRRDEHLVTAIGDAVKRFMEKHIRADVAPDGTPGEEFLASIQRVEGKAVPIPGQLVDAWLDLKARRLELAKQEAEARNAVIAALGDAVIGECEDGSRVVYKLCERREYTVQAGVYRSLQFKKAL